MRGPLTTVLVVAALFFGGRELVERFGHGDPWRTADGLTECRTKLGGTVQARPVPAVGAEGTDWSRPAPELRRSCERAEPD